MKVWILVTKQHPDVSVRFDKWTWIAFQLATTEPPLGGDMNARFNWVDSGYTTEAELEAKLDTAAGADFRGMKTFKYTNGSNSHSAAQTDAAPQTGLTKRGNAPRIATARRISAPEP